MPAYVDSKNIELRILDGLCCLQPTLDVAVWCGELARQYALYVSAPVDGMEG